MINHKDQRWGTHRSRVPWDSSFERSFRVLEKRDRCPENSSSAFFNVLPDSTAFQSVAYTIQSCLKAERGPRLLEKKGPLAESFVLAFLRGITGFRCCKSARLHCNKQNQQNTNFKGIGFQTSRLKRRFPWKLPNAGSLVSTYCQAQLHLKQKTWKPTVRSILLKLHKCPEQAIAEEGQLP
jgi:hypothetical protein